MKEFSKKWKSSVKPKKQRKYKANAPIHLKKKQLSVNLSKELRTSQNTRNIVIRKNDKVKIMRGKFKGKTGKVSEVKTKLQKIYVEGIQVKKQDGSSANVPLRPSNLQIIELNLDDKKRLPLVKNTNTKKQTPVDKKQEVKKNE